MAKPVNLIVACAANRVIGRAGRLPFHLPEDQAWFHAHTAGTVCVLGRISFETWPGATADGRIPVVISRRTGLAVGPGRTVADVPAALAAAQELPGAIMVCGGQRIYEETLPLADRLILTLVHATVPGDTFFPDWRHLAWRETGRRDGAGGGCRYTFLVLERVRSPAA